MTATTIAPPTHRHLIEVTGTGDDQSFRIICPDDGKNCQSWVECDKDHHCDCGLHPHERDCEDSCTDDHSLECNDWVYRDGMMHGEFHQYAGDVISVRGSGCWMPDWDIEFADPAIEYAPGLYDFDFDQDSAYSCDGGIGSTLDITAMRPVTA